MLLAKITELPSQKVVADKAVVTGIGTGFTVMEDPSDVAMQLSALVTETV